MDTERIYQGTLTGRISIDTGTLTAVDVATNEDIDALFNSKGLKKKGDPVDTTATDNDIDELFDSKGLKKKGELVDSAATDEDIDELFKSKGLPTKG